MCLVVADMNVVPEIEVRKELKTIRWQSSPVVGGDIATVLHGAPAGPGLDTVHRRVPDPLAPNYVLEVECGAVVHDPLGDLPA